MIGCPVDDHVQRVGVVGDRDVGGIEAAGRGGMTMAIVLVMASARRGTIRVGVVPLPALIWPVFIVPVFS